MLAGLVFFLLMVFGDGLNCALNSGWRLPYSRYRDDWTTEGLEPYHDYCMSCGCPSLTSSPWVPYFMCCVLPCQVRFGSLRSQVGVASRLVGCVRRFRPPPPPLVGFWPVVRPLFCSLAFSGFARSGPGVSCWCFPFFSFFFCVPLLGFRLGSCHLIFILISRSVSFHLPCCGRVCVCVYHLNRCKTSLLCRGVWHSCPTTRNEAVDMSGMGNLAGFLYLHFNILSSPAPGRI